jgi:hypothetical protein
MWTMNNKEVGFKLLLQFSGLVGSLVDLEALQLVFLKELTPACTG